MATAAKRAFITGITGQDGSYLAELLLAKGYTVHGMIRRSSSFNTQRLETIYQDPHEVGARLFLHYGDLCDANAISAILCRVEPSEIYNLGAQSHVRVSFDMPIYTTEVGALGSIKLLEAARDYRDRTAVEVRFYQASSSEMFGKTQEIPQIETTPFYPRSPYGCAKLFAHWATINYREAYGLHASCGILFNHESPRRYAGDYVRAMWLMLQQDEADDYVIATGTVLSVREFCELAFGCAGLEYQDFVDIDPRYLRPTEVDVLQGDPAKARRKLGWEPTTTVEALARMMVDADLELAQREQTLRDAGHDVPAAIEHDG